MRITSCHPMCLDYYGNTTRLAGNLAAKLRLGKSLVRKNDAPVKPSE